MQAPLFSLPFVLLEDRIDPKREARVYNDVVEIVACYEPWAIDEAWQRVERGLANGLHAAGYFSFELGYCLDPTLKPLLPGRRAVPLFWLGLFSSIKPIAQRDLDAFLSASGVPEPLGAISPAIDPDEYVHRVRQMLAKISDGEIYQINLTFPMEFSYFGDPLQLYAALRAGQPVAHGGMVRLPEMSIL